MRFFLISLCLFFITCFEVHSETTFKQNTMLQDDELEEATEEFLKKMFHAANIQGTPTVYFIVNKEINAAATLNHTVLIYTGFITYCNNVDEFAGVLAHEVTHIKRDDASLSEFRMGRAASPGFLAMALGGIAALATGSPEILMAGFSSGISIMERGMLKHSRSQESAADAGALDILEKLGWNAKGLETFLQRLDKRYQSKGVDPYILTHPLTSERFQKIEHYLKEHPQNRAIPSDLTEKFLRMKGKIVGFTEPSGTIFRLYPVVNQSIEARYARAISYYRSNKKNEFEKEMNLLLKDHPDDTYFLELKGQFYFEKGNKNDAVLLFEKARKNRTNKTGLDLLYAHALLEVGKDIQKAIDVVTPLVQKNPALTWGWRLLATAYGKQNKLPEAAGCLAEEAFQKREFKTAMLQAKKALLSKNPAIRDRAKTLMNEIDLNKLD
ncbi:MAG: Beta-barrel assembly-enhancing protease [Holosporales bacterium]